MTFSMKTRSLILLDFGCKIRAAGEGRLDSGTILIDFRVHTKIKYTERIKLGLLALKFQECNNYLDSDITG